MRRTWVRFGSTIGLVSLLAAAPVQAAFLVIDLPGNSTYDGWAGLTGPNYPGYGIFPGAAAWPAPIAPNESGSDGTVDFDKVSGNGYPATFSIYTPFTMTEFDIVTTGAMPFDVETVVLQLDMGPGEGGFYAAVPALNYNGGSQLLLPDFDEEGEGDYPYTNPTNPKETGTTTAWSHQWDLTGLGPISTYEIVWTTNSHGQIYEIQVDAGDTFKRFVPEPSSHLLLIAGLGGLSVATRRRRMAR